ncbi:MAG: hypothetical protein ABFD90_15590 [Phycisphaerales bacterium]
MNRHVLGGLWANPVRGDRAGTFVPSVVVWICTRVVFLLGPICLFSCVGCQSPSMSMLDVNSPEDCPFSQTQGQVTAAVWPWTDHDAVRKQFSVDLLSKRILPVQFVLTNRGEETVRFSSTQVELTYCEGITEQVISQGEMARRTQKDTAAAPWWIYVGTLGFGAPISGVMGASLEEDNVRSRQARRETYLSTITLDAQETMCGFLFFDIPREVSWRRSPLEGRLVIKRVPTSSGGSLAFSIPVTIE